MKTKLLIIIENMVRLRKMNEQDEDICGLCGEPGADKMHHPMHWPGERIPETKYVHRSCEEEECRRAFGKLTPEEVDRCLKAIR